MLKAEDAKNLMLNNREQVIDEVVALLSKLIERRASKGWSRVNVEEQSPDIFKEYDMFIIGDAYGILRENGYRVNNMTHDIIWG